MYRDRDSIGTDREGQYEQRRGGEQIYSSIYFDRGVSVCTYTYGYV
uniref:ORF45c n=1 Tax=Pinus koraiensis TaxID=88728 RepID=A4QM68_PINKO|nr:ORF45c [Pinus koraiensis]ABP35406.1 ORF45c [Pinus koraiensis]